MATFTAIRNKKQAAGVLLNVLQYVTQEKKTRFGDALLVTGHNCVPQSSFIEMTTTKNRFRKTDGMQFYHFIQSFSADDDVTPQEVNAIGLAHGLSVLEPPDVPTKKKRMKPGEYQAGLRGDSWKLDLIQAINEALEYADDRENFI